MRIIRLTLIPEGVRYFQAEHIIAFWAVMSDPQHVGSHEDHEVPGQTIINYWSPAEQGHFHVAESCSDVARQLILGLDMQLYQQEPDRAN